MHEICLGVITLAVWLLHVFFPSFISNNIVGPFVGFTCGMLIAKGVIILKRDGHAKHKTY